VETVERFGVGQKHQRAEAADHTHFVFLAERHCIGAVFIMTQFAAEPDLLDTSIGAILHHVVCGLRRNQEKRRLHRWLDIGQPSQARFAVNLAHIPV